MRRKQQNRGSFLSASSAADLLPGQQNPNSSRGPHLTDFKDFRKKP